MGCKVLYPICLPLPLSYLSPLSLSLSPLEKRERRDREEIFFLKFLNRKVLRKRKRIQVVVVS